MFENDIAMCFGTDCELKEKCYRCLAKPDKYQTYFTEVPIKDNKCESFLDIERFR